MVVVADVNRDGILDLLTANGGNAAANGVSLLLGNGDGTFQAPRSFLPGTSPNMIVSGDFNGDGNVDFAVTNTASFQSSTTVNVMLGNGDGTFLAAPDILTGGLGVSSLAAVDFNNDGKTDLAVSTMLSVNLNFGSFNLAILLGQTGGTFTTASNMPVGSGYGVLTGDFNSDGKKDILVLSSSLMKLGNGDGTFIDGTPYPLGIASGIAYDINGDGKLDIVGYTGGRTRSGLILYSSLGNGDGTFNPLTGFGPISGFTGGNILAADFNGDGLIDFVNNWGATNNFQAASIWGGPIAWGNQGGWLALGDFDRNGALDLVQADGSGVNIARSTFGNPPLLGLETLDSSFVVGGAATVTGTVTIGAPAPAGGVVIRLASDNPAAFFAAGNTVTIPAGSISAPLSVSTSAVALAVLVNISASAGSVTLNASFTVVPAFAVSTVSLAPSSILGFFGGNGVIGTVTLSGPASENVVVNLTSSNTAVATVQPSVAIAAGTTSAQFIAIAFHVNANTAVSIAAAYQGTTRSGILNVLKAADTVTITKTEYVVSKSQFKLEVTSSDPSATFMRVFNAITGVQLFPGSIAAAGGGKFVGQFIVPGPFTSVAVQSASGGLAIGAVVQK